MILTDRGPGDAEALAPSETEIFRVTEPVVRGVPLIRHETPPVVGPVELTEADSQAPLEIVHEYK
jgi:hypothetical protein